MVRTCLVITALACATVGRPVMAAQGGNRTPTSAPATAPAATVVNINTASAADLEALPGIGAKTAARIVEYRQKNGPFKKVEELMNVRGVGEKNFLKLKAQLSVGVVKPDRAAQ